MQAQEELKGLIKEVFEKEIKASEQRQAEKLEAWQKEFAAQSAEKQKEISNRIAAIEATPVVKSRLAIPGKEGKTTDVYLGVKMDRQLTDVFNGQRLSHAKELIVNPKLFPVMADDNKREEFAKHIIMVVKSATGDLKARTQYEDWREKYVETHKAALNEGTGSQGGFLVPDEYADEILAFARLKSVALQDCRIWPMGSDVRRVPAENAKVTVSWKSEGTAADQTEPTFNEVVLTAKKLTAYSIASNELLQDSTSDIVSYLTDIFSEAVGQELDNQVFNGTGDPWSGILTAAAGFSVIMSTGLTNFSSISGDNLLELIDKINQEAEEGAKFYFHKNILTYIRKLKDTQNQYLFAPIAGGLPTDIWSYPFVRVPKMPKTSDSGTGKAFVAFGNLRHFALGRRLESMTLDVDPYGKFLENQTRFRTVSRWGGALGLSGAVSRLVTA